MTDHQPTTLEELKKLTLAALKEMAEDLDLIDQLPKGKPTKAQYAQLIFDNQEEPDDEELDEEEEDDELEEDEEELDELDLLTEDDIEEEPEDEEEAEPEKKTPPEPNGNTLTAKQVATRIGTDAKSLRKFFRSSASTVEAVGQGGRYEFDKADLPKIKAEFEAWNSKKPARTTRSASAAKDEPRRQLIDDSDIEAEELDLDELDLD